MTDGPDPHTKPSNPTPFSPIVSDPSLISTEPPPDIDEELDKINGTIGNPDAPIAEILDASDKLKDILDHPMEKNETLMNTIYIIKTMHAHSDRMSETQMDKFSDNMIDCVSKIIGAEKAWNKMEHPQERVKLSSNILEYIQSTGYTLGCLKDNSDNNGIEIIKPNIVVKTFTLNQEQIDFKVKNIESYITIPARIPIPPPVDDKCKRGTAVGSMFDKLSTYLTNHLDDKHIINSNIVAFSVQNNKNSTQLPKGIPPVKVV